MVKHLSESAIMYFQFFESYFAQLKSLVNHLKQTSFSGKTDRKN